MPAGAGRTVDARTAIASSRIKMSAGIAMAR
jgi:hypothetical protein